MSCEELPKQGKQKTFKGVEQFLRRVAFNLGNSPSQTEVKIISCIPIDVTDLQHKIIFLEKELELAKKKSSLTSFKNKIQACHPPPPICLSNTSIQPIAPSKTPQGTSKTLQGTSKTPQGTSKTPQGTSKKPRCAKDNLKVTAQPAAACVQLCEEGYIKWSGSEASCESAWPPSLSMTPSLTTPTLTTPTLPTQPPPPPPPPPLSECKFKENSECLCWPTDISLDGDYTNCFKRAFFKRISSKKKKSQKKKVNCKAQFVYYAQTENSPFSIYENQKIPIKDNNLPINGGISRAYITEMIHKQYAAVPIAKEFSATSQFSSPVCRDADGCDRRPAAYDSDLCSCCRGAFHNIDCDTTNRNHAYINNDQLPNCSFNTYVNTTDFYDSSLYDMVPVREKPVKPPNLYYETPKRKIIKNDMIMSRFPERNRQKYRYHPFIVNNSKVYKKEPLVNKKENYRRYSPKREEVTRKAERNCDEESVRSCSIDCGPVYTKVHQSAKAPPVVSIMPVTVKNAECLTSSLNDTECQTNTTQSNYAQIGSDFYEDKKTEETLDQIKVILQSVLTEVKTNTHVKQKPVDKPTKGTLAQGLSSGAVPGCSSMLNSYNHSPYNMNLYDISSCSQQINPGACCYSNVSYASGKCLQNFPVFIQTPGRNMCSSCYRNSSHVTKGASPRLAGTPAATNTDAACNDRSNETAKLIKEIYKSITVNMEAPKDNSASEYGGAKKSTRSSVNHSLDRFQDKGVKIVMKSNAASMKNEDVQKWAKTVPTFNSKLTSNSVSLKTQRTQASGSTDTERRLRNNRIESYLKNIEAQKSRNNKIAEEYELTTRTPSENEFYSDYESERYSAAATSKLPQKKPEKKGLFSKMFKRSAKLFSAKKKKKQTKKKEVQVQEQEEQCQQSDAESDDYQTIYSDREMRFEPRRARAADPRRMRIPRRDAGWPDQQTHRYSSETSRSRDTDPRRWNPMYYQHYEARNALVQQRLRVGAGTGAGAGVSVGVGMGAGVGTATHREVTVPRAPGPSVNVAAKGLSWLKRHKMGARCGERWKNFILEG